MWGDMQSKTMMMEAPLPPPADPLFIGLRRRIDPEKKELLGGGLEPTWTFCRCGELVRFSLGKSSFMAISVFGKWHKKH